MRFWADDPTEVEVQWLIPEPGAKLFEPICSFRSRHTWQRGEDVQGVGEVTGRRYPYNPGPNVLGYKGDNFCGSMQATFGGGVFGRDAPIVTEGDGNTPCCHVAPPPPVGFGYGFLDYTSTYTYPAYGIPPANTHQGIWVLFRLGGVGLPVVVPTGWDLLATHSFDGGTVQAAVLRRKMDNGILDGPHFPRSPTDITLGTGWIHRPQGCTVVDLAWKDNEGPPIYSPVLNTGSAGKKAYSVWLISGNAGSTPTSNIPAGHGEWNENIFPGGACGAHMVLDAWAGGPTPSYWFDAPGFGRKTYSATLIIEGVA